MSSDSPDTLQTEYKSDNEYKVSAIWQEVLALPELPAPADDFFALGGDSTAMLMVELRIQEELAVEIPTGSLLTTPTVQELARLLDDLRASRHAVFGE